MMALSITVFFTLIVYATAFRGTVLRAAGRRQSAVVTMVATESAGFFAPLLDLLQPAKKGSSAANKAQIAELKAELYALSEGTSNGVKASEEKRAQVADVVTKLEKLNAVKKIANNELMNGNWRLVFTTNDGSSAGKLGPFVGRVDQDISVADAFYTNFVRLGPVTGALTASWDTLGDKLWRVKFQDVTLSVFGIPLTQKALSATGIWRMTYQDEDLRILYAQGGKNTVKENVYVLRRDAF